MGEWAWATGAIWPPGQHVCSKHRQASGAGQPDAQRNGTWRRGFCRNMGAHLLACLAGPHAYNPSVGKWFRAFQRAEGAGRGPVHAGLMPGGGAPAHRRPNSSRAPVLGAGRQEGDTAHQLGCTEVFQGPQRPGGGGSGPGVHGRRPSSLQPGSTRITHGFKLSCKIRPQLRPRGRQEEHAPRRRARGFATAVQ